MLFLKILGILLAVLLVLLLIPLRAEIGFQEEFTLKVRYAFLKFQLVPAPEKPQKEKKKKKKEPEPSGEGSSTGDQLKAIFQRTGVKGLVRSLTDLAKLATHSLKRLFSHLKFKAFDLYLCVGGAEDAAQAAIQYGQFSAAVYSAVGIFFSRKPCKDYGVTVDLNYDARETTAIFATKLSILPIFAVREGLSLLFRGFPIVWKLIRPPKKQALPASGREPHKPTKRPEPGPKGESV